MQTEPLSVVYGLNGTAVPYVTQLQNGLWVLFSRYTGANDRLGLIDVTGLYNIPLDISHEFIHVNYYPDGRPMELMPGLLTALETQVSQGRTILGIATSFGREYNRFWELVKQFEKHEWSLREPEFLRTYVSRIKREKRKS